MISKTKYNRWLNMNEEKYLKEVSEKLKKDRAVRKVRTATKNRIFFCNYFAF